MPKNPESLSNSSLKHCPSPAGLPNHGWASGNIERQGSTSNPDIRERILTNHNECPNGSQEVQTPRVDGIEAESKECEKIPNDTESLENKKELLGAKIRELLTFMSENRGLFERGRIYRLIFQIGLR